MSRSHVRVRGWWAIALAATGLMAVPWPSWLIEAGFARGIYPSIQRMVTTASNLLAVPLLDGLLIGVGAYLVFRLVQCVRAARERGLWSAIWELARRLVRTAALIALVFLCLWGFNYRRTPLERTLRNGAAVSITAADIRDLADHAIDGTHRTRPAPTAPLDRSLEGVAARLAGPFQNALRYLGMPSPIVVGRPKVSGMLTPFFTAAGFTGMVNPFGLESIVSPQLLPFERPMVLAHEWAHLAGFADEADASAVAWLACTEGDADLAYSAQLFVVIEASSALPGSVWRELQPTLDPGVVDDLDALAQRLKLIDPGVRQKAVAVYDNYLRTNQVADGVRSYSRVLRVLTALGAKGVSQKPAVSPPSGRAPLPAAPARRSGAVDSQRRTK